MNGAKGFAKLSGCVSPGERPPGTPRWLKAPFLRHGALAPLAWGGDPPGTPRWLKAPFLRHGALALLACGGPLEPPAGQRRSGAACSYPLDGVRRQRSGHICDYGGFEEAWRRLVRPQPTWVVVCGTRR